MLNSTDRMANDKAERDAAAKAARRAEEASIVAGLRTVLQADEQLLGFARARIAGGIKGRLNIGPEAFFAPFVNIGLTERRFVIQHLHGETGRPSEILPHFFAIADLQSIHFADIETYGGTPASRLVLHLANGQSFRLRLTGENNFASSKSLAEVFRSLTSVRKNASGPTQRVCNSCRHIMDRPSKFCPYCGTSQMDVEVPTTTNAASAGKSHDQVSPVIDKANAVVTENRTDLLDDALAFLRSEPPESPVAPTETAAGPEPTLSDTSGEGSIDESSGDTDGQTTGLKDEPSATEVHSDTPQPIADATGTGPPAERSGIGLEPSSFPDFSAPVDLQEQPLHTEAAHSTALEPSPESAADAHGAATMETPTSNDIPTSGSETAAVSPEMVDLSLPVEHPLEAQAPIDATSTEESPPPAPGSMPFTSTYSEAGSSEASTVPMEETPQMPGDSNSTAKPLRVHFHIKHPAVQFDQVITGRDADDVVSQLKDRVVAELKFHIRLAAMRLSPLEFAQEIVSKYNQEEHQSLPRPSSCREFLHLVQAIGYATVDEG